MNVHKTLIFIYYPTALLIVQKAPEMSTNIPRYCTVGHCIVPCARSFVTLVFSFKLRKEVQKR